MSNEGKSRALGMNVSTAANRLRKLIMWRLVQETGQDGCFRCGQKIEDVDDLSIEHKEPWQGADDPKASFFDLENIAFSHLGCNSSAGRRANRRKDCCPVGHPYSGDNLRIDAQGSRNCRACQNPKTKARMQKLRNKPS